MKLFFTAIVAIAGVSSTNAALEETKVADVPVVLEKKPALRIKGANASPPLTVQRSVAAKKKASTTKATKKKATTKLPPQRKLLLRTKEESYDYEEHLI